MNNERILSHKLAKVLSLDDVRNISSGSMSISQTAGGSWNSIARAPDTTSDVNID